MMAHVRPGYRHCSACDPGQAFSQQGTISRPAPALTVVLDHWGNSSLIAFSQSYRMVK